MRLDTWSARARSKRPALVLWTLTCLVGFTALGQLATSGGIDRLDDAVLDWTTSHRTPLLTALVRLVSFLGTRLALTCATVFVVIGFWSRNRRTAALAVATSCVASGFLTPALKLWFARPRPPITTQLFPIDGFSFPSGHASGIAALLAATALVLTPIAPTRRRRVALLLLHGAIALAVGASRVYLGAHYPSDVVGGLLLGIACGLAALATLGPRAAHERAGAHAREPSTAASRDRRPSNDASDRAAPPGSARPSRVRTRRDSSPAGRS